MVTTTSSQSVSAPRQARAVERRAQLLDAAARVFARRGYERAQMEEIAAAADTSKGGLYFHFPNKEALAAAVIGRAGDLLQRRVSAAMSAAGTDPVARADAALATLVRTLSTHRSLARVLASETLSGSAAARHRAGEIEDDFVALIAAELRTALDAGRLSQLEGSLDPELTARAWVGLVQSMLSAWATGRIDAPIERIYPELRRLLLRSAGAPLAPVSDLHTTITTQNAEE